MGLSPLPRLEHARDPDTCGHVQLRFAFLVWDLHPFSTLFRMGSTPHPPSVHPTLTWSPTPS